MKAVVGIILLGVAWVIAQAGRHYDTLALTLCAVPIAIIAVAIYYHMGKPQPTRTTKPFVNEQRLSGEENLPEWVIKARRQMERNERQSRPKA